jgi:hypothetical protein
MPIEACYAPQGLKPEGIRQAPQDFVYTALLNDHLDQGLAKPFHVPKKPGWTLTAMERKVGSTGFHSIYISCIIC